MRIWGLLIGLFLMVSGLAPDGYNTAWANNCQPGCDGSMAGKLCYATDEKKFYGCDGVGWKTLESGASGASDETRVGAECWSNLSSGTFIPATVFGSFTSITSTNTQSSQLPQFCGLKTNGDVQCWGGFWGAMNPKTGPFSTISAAERYYCGITTGGDIECWGSCFPNNAANSSCTANWPRIKTGPFIALDLGGGWTTEYEAACAIRGNGNAHCWGNNNRGKIVDNVTGPFTAIALSEEHACALKTNGDLQCWGGNDPDVPRSIAGPFIAIDGSYDQTCALKANGDLQCWGRWNGVPIASATGPFTAVTTGELHTCALKTNGDVQCWGLASKTGPFTGIATGGRGSGQYKGTCAIK